MLCCRSWSVGLSVDADHAVCMGSLMCHIVGCMLDWLVTWHGHVIVVVVGGGCEWLVTVLGGGSCW